MNYLQIHRVLVAPILVCLTLLHKCMYYLMQGVYKNDVGLNTNIMQFVTNLQINHIGL